MKIVYCALSAAALLAAACHKSEPAAGTAETLPAIDARIIEATTTDLPVHEEVVGTVQPALQATVSSKTTGRIIEMKAIPGVAVKQGELLAKVEAPQLEAALARAEAALENSRSEAERYRSLRDKGSVSQRDIDRVETQLRVATAERDQIRSQLDEAEIVAPFAGRITRRHLDTGDLVQPGAAVCRIEDPTRLRFEMHVAETLANRIELGRRFKVAVGPGGVETEGTVAEVSPAADTGSRTFLVKLDLPAGEKMLAGQFGRAFLPRGSRPAVVVAESALLQRGQLCYAAVVDAENLAHLRIVRTGQRSPEGVEILSGLEAGERILAEIPADFAGGTPVNPSL
ncbi:efflux RND transporter periplasmic adaptor subunit [Haloferula sp. A504]|uniref:efflux RND transporter periplasmic adaptor subunit n=1 Tax=Haloferula sp. A504 TaxID=3373601 RepID=UPI0031C30B4E|nr:efflux RND transporter periplasmic adaptor subunit [Verrucomicrobiaceae bacterium E54]